MTKIKIVIVLTVLAAMLYGAHLASNAMQGATSRRDAQIEQLLNGR